MLTRVWSPAFEISGKVRPPITFRPRLNLTEGGCEAEKSIGKSTIREFIEFAYGGRQFLNSDVVRLPQAVGHHTIYFSLRLNGLDYHLSRATDRPGFITAYDAPEWKTQSGEMADDDYRQILLENYGLAKPGYSWRDLIGRFCRVDQSDLSVLDHPLAAAPQEPNAQGTAALLRLFDLYDEIEAVQEEFIKASEDLKTLQAMAKAGYSPYVQLKTKKERAQAANELHKAQSQFKQLRIKADVDLFEADRQTRAEQQRMSAELRPLRKRISQLEGKRAIVDAALNGKSRITSEDLQEFYTYFPDVNQEKLETIEYYHSQLEDILEDQLVEQKQIYETLIRQLTAQVRRKMSEIHALGQSVEIDDEIYDQNAELAAKIKQYEQQIEMFDKTQEINERKKQLHEELKTAIPNKLDDLKTAINQQMSELNALLYPDKKLRPPILDFKLGRKGATYTFDHNGDIGAGSRSKNLLVFDLTVLKLSPLPLLIHDSVLIKNVAFAPVRQFLALYEQSNQFISGANEPKQVFLSFDATKAYGEDVGAIVNRVRVVHLGEDDHALYGFTWNIETDANTQHGDPQ